MKVIKMLFFIGLIINTVKLQAQQVDKIAGVCFRIDDVQSPANLMALDSIFSKYGKHFTYATNPQIAKFTQTSDYWDVMKILQLKGHELGDHSPNHYTHFFDVANTDSNNFKNRKGVDHIKNVNNAPIFGTRVCLKYTINNANGIGDETNINVRNNMIISKANGEFSNQKIYGSGKSIIYFYLPSINKVVGFNGFKNLNSNDPDTAIIKSFWSEEIDLGILNDISYKKLSNFDIDIDKDGFRIMLQLSLDIFRNKGLGKPSVWIQPGGETPYLTKKYIAEVCGDEFGYLSAATYPGSFKGFNEADFEKNNIYNMQWQDFQEENQSVALIKSIIVDRFARHTLSFGSNHLGVFGANFPLKTIINNMDQILAWCVQNNIPVYTYSEWGKIIYNSQTNPENNVLPPLQNDLNKDGIIDGYSALNGLDTVVGIGQSNYRAIVANSSNTMFQITKLSGIESGPNNLSLYSKGGAGNKVSFYIDFPELNKYVSFDLPASTGSYAYQNYTFEVPKGVSFVSIICSSQIVSGGLTITGLSLKGTNKPYVKLPVLKRWANESFATIRLKNYAIDKFHSVNNIEWSVLNSRIFNTNINSNSDLTVSVSDYSKAFWVGLDSIQIIAKSIGGSDTVWLNILSSEKRVCADQRLSIKYTQLSNDSILSWYSVPANAAVSNFKGSDLFVYPNVSTIYYLKVTKTDGSSYTNSINITVVLTKFVGNVTIPRGFQSSSTLNITIDVPFYGTGLIAKFPNRQYVFLNDNEISFTKGTLLGNDTLIYKITTNACEASTVTIITSDKNIGTKELTNNDIQVFPNPFNNELNINLAEQARFVNLSIVDLLGKVHYNNTFSNEKDLLINTEFLSSGIYYVKFESDGLQQAYFQKIIKQ